MIFHLKWLNVMFEHISSFFNKSYSMNLFKVGVVLSGVVLLMFAQIFPYIYDKELSLAKAKIKLELAYMKIQDKHSKENSIEYVSASSSADRVYYRRNFDHIFCEDMNELRAECETAKFESLLFSGYINVFNKLVDFCGVVAVMAFAFSFILFIDWTRMKKIFMDGYLNFRKKLSIKISK